jgi:hypothetical protein
MEMHPFAGRLAPSRAARIGILQGKRISPTAFARQAGKVQYLGEMPWDSRATAFKPDAVYLSQTAAKVNQR